MAVGLLTVIAVVLGWREPELPNPNGWDRLVALASEVQLGEVLALDANSPEVTAQFAAAHSNLVSQVQEALELPARVPVAHDSRGIGRHMNGLVSLPLLEKGMLAIARQREVELDPIGATQARLAVIRLGQQGIRGGSLMDYSVGVPIQISGLRELTNSLAQMNSDACHLALAEVRSLGASQEPLSDFVARTRRWMLLDGEWWRDWTAAKDLPMALLELENQTDGNGKTARASSQELEAAFMQAEASLVRRIAELDKQKGGSVHR